MNPPSQAGPGGSGRPYARQGYGGGRGGASQGGYTSNRRHDGPGDHAGRPPRTFASGPHQGYGRSTPSSSNHASLQEVSTMPTYKVTPHAATQANVAQHGATVVRTGTTHTQESNGGRGTVQFYSSVQRKGGAFTDSEAATLRQLGPQRNIQKLQQRRERAEQGGQGDRIMLTSAGNLTRQALAAVEKKYTEAETKRRERDFAAVRQQEAQRKRSRFELDSSSQSSSSRGESDDED